MIAQESHFVKSNCTGSRHEAEVWHCLSCGRPVSTRLTGGGVCFCDGRVPCLLWRQRGIDSVAREQPVLAEVRRRLAGLGLDLGAEPTPLRLVGGLELAGAVPQRLRRGRVDEIVVLHGLPSAQ